MDDLISRQAAIDALMVWEEESKWDEECLEHRGEPFLTAPSDVVEQLPSAQPEIVRCRECKRWNTVLDRNKAEYGLCQNRSQLEATKADFYCANGERRSENDGN